MGKILDKQVHIYSLGTDAFYNEKEMKIHNVLKKNYKFRTQLKKIVTSKKNETYEIDKVNSHIKNTNKRIKRLKEKLRKALISNSEVRILRNELLYEKNVVSIFESALTRTLKINTNTLSTDLFVIQVYFFEVLKDISLNGFIHNNEKYIIFTASAGQLRVKKVVCIKERLLNKFQNTLMCGLTTDDINNLGGMNINKLLAYKSLYSTSTDEWIFDIDRSIVVEDMELPVGAEVDYIDNKTYEITRKTMDIPIVHTDGAGMISCELSKKNFMFRMPWFKGILASFDFKEYITSENEGMGKVKDIWGKEWDIIEDRIEIIFTKSQFKMYKFYKDWNDYKTKFKKFNCQCGICSIEEDYVKDSRLNYQMLQSLSRMLDGELERIAEETIQEIKNISTSKEVMLNVLGVRKNQESKYAFHNALKIYPELLNDNYTKNVLKDIKKSLVKEAKSSKLKINGKYLFLIPDMFAFCQWLFKNEKEPKGLLSNGEVYCSVYKDKKKVDVLRSPHLFREHGIRNNVIDEEKAKWFSTNGIYTSVLDPLSKLLQFDNDGDKSLVVGDKNFVEIAERHMLDDNIVPLYYEMSTGKPEKITNEGIYNSLISAYTGSNIGEYSNSISKIWNNKDGDINLDVIKWLVMENNYKIDFAKTKVMPTRPKHVKREIQKHTKLKVPHFFIYAKNKGKHEVEKVNKSTVNRLNKIIPNPRINFKKMGQFDYRMLMSGENKNVDLNKNIIDKYAELDSKCHFMSNIDEKKYNNHSYIHKGIRDQILSLEKDKNYIVDVLVEYLYKYKNSPYKTTLWMCFGEELLDNLKNNVFNKFGANTSNCEICNVRIITTNNRKSFCDKCWKEREKKLKREWDRTKRKR